MASDDLFVLASTESTGGFFMDIQLPSAAAPAPINAPAPSPFVFKPMSTIPADSSCLKYVKKVPMVDLPWWWGNPDAMGTNTTKISPFAVEVVALGQYLQYVGQLTVTSDVTKATPFVRVADWSALLHVGSADSADAKAGLALQKAYLASLSPEMLLGLGYTAMGKGVTVVAFGHNLWKYEKNCPPAPKASPNLACCQVAPKHTDYVMHSALFYPGTDTGANPMLTTDKVTPSTCPNLYRADWTFACQNGGMFLIDNYSQAGSKNDCKPTAQNKNGTRPASGFGPVPAEQMLRFTAIKDVNCVMPPVPPKPKKPAPPSAQQQAQTTLDKYKKYIRYGALGLGAILLLALAIGMATAIHSRSKMKAAEATVKAQMAPGGHHATRAGRPRRRRHNK